jgi:hypothetical protein
MYDLFGDDEKLSIVRKDIEEKDLVEDSILYMRKGKWITRILVKEIETKTTSAPTKQVQVTYAPIDARVPQVVTNQSYATPKFTTNYNDTYRNSNNYNNRDYQSYNSRPYNNSYQKPYNNNYNSYNNYPQKRYNNRYQNNQRQYNGNNQHNQNNQYNQNNQNNRKNDNRGFNKQYNQNYNKPPQNNQPGYNQNKNPQNNRNNQNSTQALNELIKINKGVLERMDKMEKQTSVPMNYGSHMPMPFFYPPQRQGFQF